MKWPNCPQNDLSEFLSKISLSWLFGCLRNRMKRKLSEREKKKKKKSSRIDDRVLALSLSRWGNQISNGINAPNRIWIWPWERIDSIEEYISHQFQTYVLYFSIYFTTYFYEFSENSSLNLESFVMVRDRHGDDNLRWHLIPHIWLFFSIYLFFWGRGWTGLFNLKVCKDVLFI